MKKIYFIVAISGFIFFATSGTAIAAKNTSGADSILTKLLNAVEKNDFNKFIADGDAQFKAAITKQMFESVNAQITPRMKKGYEIVTLGTLKQQGCQVFLMKLVFKDDGDDILAKLALRDGKIVGFLLQ